MKTLVTTLVAYLMLSTVNAQQPNIIFFLVDDLNDYVGILGGHPQVQTPHIDALAARGVTFINAYANAPGCAPSRTSLLSGKSPYYTGVMSNAAYLSPFRDNFSAANGNATVFTFPEILKDSGNYFTYGLGKIFHSPNENDYDNVNPTCSKSKSWNRMHSIQETNAFDTEADTYMFNPALDFGMIPDDMESDMCDQRLADSAVSFIHGVAAHTVNTCDRPFLLTLGIRRPHSDRLIPQHYFPPYFTNDLLADTISRIYNYPPDATPFNGLVMPPQPEPMFNDFYMFPEGSIANFFADQTDVFNALNDYVAELPWLPVIDPALTDAERIAILEENMRANYVASYIAAVQFMDSVVGKVLEALNAHPDLAENTVVVFTSDHGYSLGEKRHWTKWALWETDIRVPLIIAHPEGAQNVVSKRVTSLLDIFPTMCSIAGVSVPDFPDGTPYPDGQDLMPFITNPGMNSSNAAVTINKTENGLGSCFPQYSVRTERFHYIRYRQNNTDPAIDNSCNDASANYEYELYDIGTDRQVDPYEWNNVAADPEYMPLIPYLESFLPEGPLYNQEPLTVNIYTNTTECLLSNDAVAVMRCLLLHPDGTLIEGPELSNYTFTWTNNLTADIYTGIDYTFPLSDIPFAIFETANDLIFYLTVTKTGTDAIVAFRIREFQLHPESMPDITYALMNNGLEIDIQDVTLHGSAHSITWNFGDGISAVQTDPGPHMYTAEGSYTLTTTMQYGNKCSITQSQIIDVDTAIFRMQQPRIDMQLYPNPADDQVVLHMTSLSETCTAVLLDMQGNRILTWMIDTERTVLNLPDLPAGTYILRMQSDLINTSALLIIQHP